jgi:cupin 2 domain-containing protein
MLPEIRNLFAAPDTATTEQFETLLQTQAFRLEQIVSHGQHSAPDFWYDQPQAEWVLLLQGTAVLEFEERSLPLQAGDTLLIPPHQKHRVAACSGDAIWLALHFHNPS